MVIVEKLSFPSTSVIKILFAFERADKKEESEKNALEFQR